MSIPFTFQEIEANLSKGQVGLYEIRTRSGIGLKVGIAIDLLERLKDHRASRDSGLKLKPGGAWHKPGDIQSKKSILAKHLYFDRQIAPAYDLTTQRGRREFLQNECTVLVVKTSSKEEARILEGERERSGEFRYVGDVIVRDDVINGPDTNMKQV